MSVPGLPRGDAVVIGVGARTPAALTALQATMAVRAEKMLPRECSFVDRQGDPMVLCRLPAIPDRIIGLERWLALGAGPLRQAAFEFERRQRARLGRATPLPLILALPAEGSWPRGERLKEAGAGLLSRLEAESGVLLDHARSEIVTLGRAGGAEALRRALALLAEGQAEAVAVGGLDSYFDPDVLEGLDRSFRLHAIDTENGFIPGEAGAFLVLARRSKAFGVDPLGEVLGVAIEREPRLYGSDEPCHALALTKALGNAAARLGESRSVDWVMTDVVNERHRVEEWQLAFTRSFRLFAEEVRHDQPLLATGDVGAASAPLCAVLACVSWQTRSAPGRSVLIGVHSDAAERGAVLLREGAAG